MKKIYYLLAFVAMAFTACQKQPNVAPQGYTKKGMAITLPTTTTFTSTDDAKTKIPGILDAKYPQLDNGSSATVTFTLSPVSVKPADSLLTDISYTVTPADYATVLGPNPKYLEFTSAQVISFLGIKYPNPQPNQLSFLTYIYFESGVTPSAIPNQTDTFIYLNGAWVKCYTLTAAQYASTGHPYNDFSSTDDAKLATYFNLILKNDIVVSSNSAAGNIQYVSYKYYGGKNFQRIAGMTFDGTNWVATPTTGSLSFSKSGGKWILDVSVNYTLVKDDYTYIGTQTKAGSDAARANVAQYPDFNISSPDDATYWSDDDLNAALIAVLTNKFKSTAITDQKFIVTYTVYSFGKTSNVAKTFTYDGSIFKVFVPEK
ncbi:hypothetical protein SNE25_22120 [Mucilaginibacter sabulilitoris]|uniref:DUF5017 domain-containing protein n=1 Tax=Mucilaginibacter sabulilitoris TaxID=1173583 RepID=A0ABZ0TGX3_9SPHI|nr:hypothetical protein [Mucilaginibacter sabulilitoris]WPU92019.1 hypothetical protein SNE25_22120 [Mucilaginibacter sabulilitoris]